MRIEGGSGPVVALTTVPPQAVAPVPVAPLAATDALVKAGPARDPDRPGALLSLAPADPLPAFKARFGSESPCRPDREPLAGLLRALALPEGAEGLKGLRQLLADKAPGPTAVTATPDATAETAAPDGLDADAFARLKAATTRWADRWAEKGGSIADLATIRALQSFVTGQAPAPVAATVGYGPTLAEARTQTVNGIELVSPAGVSEQSVAKAVALIQRMASPEVAARLVKGDAQVIVIPTNALMTDVSEFQSLRGILTPDGRPWETVRGVGDVSVGGRRVVALPEESLLDDQKHDPQPAGYSAATHEFAHLILRIGLKASEVRAIGKHYGERSELGKDSFTDAYAASNVDEYFAQATCAYFGVNAGQGKGRDFLAEKDPEMLARLTAIYGPVAATPTPP